MDVIRELEGEVYTWNDAKAEANVRKHGITFDEALLAFTDTDQLVEPDRRHPERGRLLGFSIRPRILLVIYADVEDLEEGAVVRIISARRAKPTERRRYEAEKLARYQGRDVTRPRHTLRFHDVLQTRLERLRRARRTFVHVDRKDPVADGSTSRLANRARRRVERLRAFDAALSVKSVPQRIRALRKAREWSQEELARRSGLAQSTICHLESGRINLGLARATKLASAFEIHPSKLLWPGT